MGLSVGKWLRAHILEIAIAASIVSLGLAAAARAEQVSAAFPARGAPAPTEEEQDDG